MNKRVQRLRELLKEKSLDGLFISTPGNRRYLSGFTGSAGYLMITQQKAYLATDFRYYEQVGQQSPDFELIKVTKPLREWLPELLTGVGTLGFEAFNLTFSQHQMLKSAMLHMKPVARPKLVATEDLVEEIRVIKDPREMLILKRAVEIADKAFTDIAAALEPGQTERDIAWRLEKSMREQGAEGNSFDLIVAAGPNAALPHHRPDDTQLKMNETLIIDMGCRLEGYCSDLSRTVWLGKPTDQYRRVYDTVLAAQETAINAVQAGMTGHECDKLARDVIEKAGFGDNFGHGTGHGVGLDIHENPRVSRNQKNVLKDEMAFTIEPGIYLPGWGGVRIEDIVILEKGRSRDLTKAHKRDTVPA